MYKIHRLLSAFIFILTFLTTLFLEADYSRVSEIAISIVSISLAVYIGAASVLLGSDFAKKLKDINDPEIKTSTQLGVLSAYLRIAGKWSIVTILASAIYILDFNWNSIIKLLNLNGKFIIEIVSTTVSSFCCSVFVLNVYFIWLIMVFLINAMNKSV